MLLGQKPRYYKLNEVDNDIQNEVNTGFCPQEYKNLIYSCIEPVTILAKIMIIL